MTRFRHRMFLAGAALLPLIGAQQATAKQASAVSTAPAAAYVPMRPRTILFIGNSFTQGALSAVRNYRADTVHDLMNAGYGGVPALFKQFADQMGLAYEVSLETQGGMALRFHWEQRRVLVDRVWDVVVLQDLSKLDRATPGDPADHVAYTGLLAAMMKRANPAVEVDINATWTRADQTYLPTGHWYGKPVETMANDLRAAADLAQRTSRDVYGVIPTGQAWNRAMATGIADPDPYDGTAANKLDLWAYDHYHASIAGYYLEALTIFGKVTGADPRLLGAAERAADALGLSPEQAVALQKVASDELAAGPR